MDPAVSLVQAYLRANGYFTVTEYPVVRRVAPHDYRSVTDLDVLAVRFPGATRFVPSGEPGDLELALAMDDPALSHEEDRIEIIIGEVKEGRAELNRGATEAAVMRAALLRFGIVRDDEFDDVVEDLLKTGRAISTHGYRVRLFAFGSYVEEPPTKFEVILLGEIFEFFRRHAERFSDMLGAAEYKDPAVGLLMVAAKSGFLKRGGGIDGGPPAKRHKTKRRGGGRHGKT